MRGIKMLALAGASLFLSWAALAQVGVDQQEKMMIQKLKMSDGKLQEGKALFAKGKLDKAEKKFQECLGIFPKNAEASYFMAQILLKKDNMGKALESIETAKACFSELGKLYASTFQETLEKLSERRDQLQDEILMLLENLRRLQSSGSSQTNIANVMNDIQQRRNEIEQIDNELRKPFPEIMETPADYFYVHGNVLFKLKDYRGAVVQYLETIKRDPKHGFAYNNLANIYFMAKQYDQALRFLEQAEVSGIEVNPQFKKDIKERLAKK